MNNLKYLEASYYKIIIDLLKTLKKYNFTADNIRLRVRNYTTNRTENITYSNLESIQNYYKQYSEISNVINCEFGNDIYLDNIDFNSLLYNTDISFAIKDVANDLIMRRKHLNNLNNYNTRFTDNQKSTLEKYLKIYSNIYSFISNTRDDSSGDYYSPCYAVPGWANDLLAKNNYDVIFKYNLFELKNQNISRSDMKAVNRILGI